MVTFSYQMIQYGNIIQWPPWAERLTRWNHVMLVTNSSFNIIIYVFQVILKYIHCDLCLSVFIRPRYTWGPIYGFECLKHTDVVETQ